MARPGDYAQITQVVQLYGKALDDKDYDLLDRVFTPDAVTTYVMDDMSSDTNYPQMRELFNSFNAAFYLTSHLISHPVIEVDDDCATAESRLIATHVQIRPDDSRSSWFVFGFYRDEFIRTEDGWRIQKRRFQSTHTEGELLPRDQVRLFEKPPWR